MPDPWFKCECGWEGRDPELWTRLNFTFPNGRYERFECPMCNREVKEVSLLEAHGMEDCGGECRYRRGE